MNRAVSRIIALVVLSLTPLLMSCKPQEPFTMTPISGPVILDVDEQEFVFQTPFRPRKQANWICFDYSDYLEVPSIADPPRFLDDSALELTASLFDEKGNVWDLNHISSSRKRRFCISPDRTDEWKNVSKVDKTFVRLRARSNRKLNVKKIEWVSVNMWDLK